MAPGLKKMLGTGVAAAIVVATLAIWTAFNLQGSMGNQFVASFPKQLLLYGRLAGILMAFAFLFQLLSMGKGRLFEQFVSKARLAKLHRRLGFTTAGLLIAHLGLIATGRTLLYEESYLKVCANFFFDGSWGSLAGIGLLLLVAVLTFSALFIAKKIKFPQWKKTHYAAYLVVLFFFFHQVIYGIDFVNHPAFRIFWIVIFALVLLDAVIWKIRLRHQTQS